jgi:hypothetical protein
MKGNFNGSILEKNGIVITHMWKINNNNKIAQNATMRNP